MNSPSLNIKSTAPASFQAKPKTYLPGPNTQLPWVSSFEQDQKFNKILYIALGIFAVLSLIIAFIPAPELSREESEKLPPQLAKVILEKKQLPKPKEPEPVVIPKEIKKEKKPEKIKKPIEPPKPEPIKAPAAKIELAKKKAAVSGLLQFQDDLMEMRDSIEPSKLASNNITRGQASADKLERSLLTDKAKISSGGINNAALSKNTGGAALSGRTTTVVDAPSNSALATGTSRVQEKDRSGRSDEEIRRTMDKNKGAIFAIYNRALRKDPSLEGKVTIKMVINAAGSITSINLVSSELADEDLENKLLARIRLINFGAKQASSTTVNYSFDFLPY